MATEATSISDEADSDLDDEFEFESADAILARQVALLGATAPPSSPLLTPAAKPTAGLLAAPVKPVQAAKPTAGLLAAPVKPVLPPTPVQAATPVPPRVTHT